jgi:hypothetical protein
MNCLTNSLTTIALVIITILAKSASAEEPPRCDDAGVLENLRSVQAQMQEETKLGVLLSVQANEQGIMDYVPALDTHKNRTMLGGYPWGSSRFCSAVLAFNSGKSDKAYYRLDAIKESIKGSQYNKGDYVMNSCFESVMHYFSQEYKQKLTCARYQLPVATNENAP